MPPATDDTDDDATDPPALTLPVRCDGCGSDATATVRHDLGDTDATVEYCLGCEMLRELRGISPGAHDQYELLEVES